MPHVVHFTIGYTIADNPAYQAADSAHKKDWRKDAYEHTNLIPAADTGSVFNSLHSVTYTNEPTAAEVLNDLEAMLPAGWRPEPDPDALKVRREHVFIEDHWVCVSSYRLQKFNDPDWIDYSEDFQLGADDLTAEYYVMAAEEHTWDG